MGEVITREKIEISKKLVEELEDKYGKNFIQYYMNLASSHIHHKSRKLRYGYLPKWFKKSKSRYETNMPVDYPLGDHFRWDKTNKVLELHPYWSSMDDMKTLISHCEENNLTFTCHGTSDYFYGNTFLVRIYEKTRN